MQVTNALLSRAQVYNLQPLSQDDFNELYERARQHLPAVDGRRRTRWRCWAATPTATGGAS